MNQYRVEIPVFNGPLDLLLHLIDREELDITIVSLAQVTDQYLVQVRQMDENQVEQLIDFIGIGARLLLIKSRALLPRPPSLPIDLDEEEDPAEALLRQLRIYKHFKAAALWLDARRQQGLRTYLRVASPPRVEGKLDMTGITGDTLLAALHGVLQRAETLDESFSLVEPRSITIEGQMEQLRKQMGLRRRLYFTELLGHPYDRMEVAVTLLALLELIKRREARAQQVHMFGPIEILPESVSTSQSEQPG
ncbi:MAG: segregation/condensation protein A [Chloroflexota bacterium]|jgi:segregation and condensation protein A